MCFRDTLSVMVVMLLLLMEAVHVEASGLCVNDTDCTATNTFCDVSVCICSPGYTARNGECSAVFGRTCLDDLDCDDGRTVCVDSKCACQSYEWQEENGVCASYYGSLCSDWSDCGHSNTFLCESNTCKCQNGHKFSNGQCKKVLNGECRIASSDEDCPLEHSVCRSDYWSWNNGQGKCKCENGFDESNDICVQVLGSSCDDVGCGNTLHYSYKYLDPSYKPKSDEYYWYGGTDSWFDYHHYYHLHLTCNTDNVCVCDHGFKANDNGTFCEPAYGTYCESADDCGGYKGYTCDYNSSQCTCAENYAVYSQEWWFNDDETTNNLYYYYWSSSSFVTMCKAELGQSCSIVNCSFENAYCNENDTCSCEDGYTESYDGTCLQVLGSSCIRETFCQTVPGGTCGVDNTCTCRYGYSQNGHLCEQGSNCVSDPDCNLDNTVCDQGICLCESAFNEYSGRCLSIDCTDVPELPDVRRRPANYKPLRDEPLIDDAGLKRTWFSIGKHSLYSSSESLQAGSCATYYPIYLTDALTTSQYDAMGEGEITVSGTVGGLDVYEQTEHIDIRLRKCGQETQIYITPPSTRFAGICLNSDPTLDISKSAGFSATVLTDLLFTNETNEFGIVKHTPYIVFACVASEFLVTTTYQRYPYEGYVPDDDIYFYYVHWYVDNVHFTSVGPLRRADFINSSSVFERDIMAAGYKLGFKIRCAFEISERPNGQNTLLSTSEDFYTGFQPIYIPVEEKTDSYFLQLKSNTPFGCETTEENSDDTCLITWPVIGENGEMLCNNSPHTENNQHNLCRVYARGYSYKKYNEQWGSWSYMSGWNLHRNQYSERNTTEIDGVTYRFSNYTTEVFGVNVDIQGADQTTGTMNIKFGPAEGSTKHLIWNGYNMPDIKFDIIGSSSTQKTCKLTMLNVPILTKEADWQYLFSSVNVEIDQIGEFTMYYSTEKPVHVQIQTEACSRADSGVCICAVNYRDGNNMYIYSYCNGLTRIGQTHGEGSNHNIKNVRLINGVALVIESTNGRIENVSLNTNHSKVLLEDGEGLCMFTDGLFKHRDGTVQTDSNGFVSSWSVPINDSLLNPSNHKSISWTDEYVQCGCPESTEVLNDRNRTYFHNNTYNYTTWINSYYSSTYTVYIGFIRCMAENICKVDYSGDGEWSGSLLPLFSISSVKARMEIKYLGNEPLLHLYCDFDGREGYMYALAWKIDGVTEYQSTPLSYTDAQEFYITNDDLQTTISLLEVGVSCGVSIYDGSDAILSTQFSDTIFAVEIVQTEVLLPRGGDAVVQIRLNIPLVCTKKHSCSFDFKLYDPTDQNDCSDASIAVKGRQTCGKRISGITSVDELQNVARHFNITLTTKNNAMYVLKDTFSLKLKLIADGPTSQYFLHTFRQEITVFVRDDEVYWQRNYCYANNDPRIRTLDGQYYNHLLVGVYVLMRHKRLPVEIQMETALCGGWRAVCVCGVTIRAGRDVYTINHCHGDHITNYLLADDGILKVRKRNAHRYQIYLPQGTKVDVRISSWNSFMVNIFIYPSPADMKSIEGLCGNFNGDWGDDLIHSDGNVTTSSRYYWWWYTPDPDDFVNSWGLSFTNGLDLTDVDEIEEALESWYEDDLFCVCTGNNGNGEIKCSANEDDTCLKPVQKPGLDISLNQSMRNKRSVISPNNEYKQRLKRMREKRAANWIKARNIVRRTVESIDEAIDYCNRTLSSSCGAMSAPNDGVNVTFEEMVYDCGKDRALNPETDWSSLTCDAMEANAENEVRMDIKLQEAKPELYKKMKNACSGNCSRGNGKCDEDTGSCTCYYGYGEDDCSVGLSDPVTLDTGEGRCDKKQYECSCMHLSTSGSVPNATFSAVHKRVTIDGTWEVVETIQGATDYINTYEVNVCPQKNSRRKRSTDNATNIAEEYVVSLTNDGSVYGSGSSIFVLDSTCLQINQTNETTAVILLSGYCIIDGVCYVTNTSSPSDTCSMCNDTADPYRWTLNEDKDGCTDSASREDEDDGQQSYLLLVIIFSLALFVVMVTVIIAVYMVKKKSNPRIIPSAPGDLYDMPKNVKFKVRKDEAWT